VGVKFLAIAWFNRSDLKRTWWLPASGVIVNPGIAQAGHRLKGMKWFAAYFEKKV